MGIPDFGIAKINSIYNNRTVLFQKTFSVASNSNDNTVCTVTGSVIIKSVVVKATAAAHADLTSIAVSGGTSKVVLFISDVDGLRVNIAATDQQVSWTGAVELGNGKTIVETFTGTNSGVTAQLVTIEYIPMTTTSTLT
jgi:hypothetical protein